MAGMRNLISLLLFLPALAVAELGVNFPEPASTTAREIYDIHMLTLRIATFLLLVVLSIVIYALIVFRKNKGYQADQDFHESWFGHWSWVIVPVLVLGIDLTIASSAQKVLEKVWEVPKEGDLLDIKVTGHQWWWEFDYLDSGIKVESRYLPKEKAGDLYLREVDNRLVLPTGRKIRFLQTSADVNHAFWVPELGFKKDAIAGFVTETWATLDREGVFRGQCAELCGTWHSRMPIVVEAVSPAALEKWQQAQLASRQAALAKATTDKNWSLPELMGKGEELFNSKCAACHQVTGLGLPPAFPPLKGSSVTMGPLADHLKVVLNGRSGTAMQAWNSLNDLEIAAIVTYERNAWGNDTGDAVQPADVKAAR